jgi:erythronate-4-phosphate dehydrogenase
LNVNIYPDSMASSRLIIADENIPQVREWFAPLGTVRTLPGRSITPADVADADILLVRSVTPVGAELLAASRVGFVGTATIGTDHLDLDWLRAAGISVASAPGSNAQSVVDYVLSALATQDGVLESLLSGGAAGIVGLGNVGSRLLRRLRQLGVDVVGYDPFVSATDLPQMALDDVLRRNVVCVHVPLTRMGSFPTFHMFDDSRLRSLPQGTLLLNAGRGAAIDNEALLKILTQRTDLRTVLDVWEGEPSISTELLDKIHLGSPHIAGYSLDGKLTGTAMLLKACSAFLGVFSPPVALTTTSRMVVITKSGVDGLRQALLTVYDPRRDDAALRAWPSDGSMAICFDRLRKHYPERREIATTVIENARELDEPTRQLLAAAGFRLD